MFLCGLLVAVLLSPLLELLAKVIRVPTDYWIVILTSPAFVIGAVLWWAAVERRESYSYPLGGLFGLATALLTGVLWTGEFIRVWGVEMARIPIVGFLVVLVIAVTSVAGFASGVPFMYLRRRLDPNKTSKPEGVRSGTGTDTTGEEPDIE